MVGCCGLPRRDTDAWCVGPLVSLYYKRVTSHIQRNFQGKCAAAGRHEVPEVHRARRGTATRVQVEPRKRIKMIFCFLVPRSAHSRRRLDARSRALKDRERLPAWCGWGRERERGFSVRDALFGAVDDELKVAVREEDAATQEACVILKEIFHQESQVATRDGPTDRIRRHYRRDSTDPAKVRDKSSETRINRPRLQEIHCSRRSPRVAENRTLSHGAAGKR